MIAPVMNETIYSHTFDGLHVRTGDILCTQDGAPGSLFGEIWRQLGRLVPGEIDHVVLYVGPGGRCVESGIRGVIVFEMPGEHWDAAALAGQRILHDTLVGAAYPLAGRGLSPQDEGRIRRGVADYCLAQAEMHRGYNINIFDLDTTGAFYCSQLLYHAYLRFGIDLNSNVAVPTALGLDRIVFPEEIWRACPTRRIPT
ncbi:MAG: hypothetical protein U0641_10665 [Anaerolineae bacterium]